MIDIVPDRKPNPAFPQDFCRGVSSRVGPPSVITQDVPDDALALGRSRQVVKQGWATRLRGLKALGKNRNQ
jgi:serine acetyltransferase